MKLILLDLSMFIMFITLADFNLVTRNTLEEITFWNVDFLIDLWSHDGLMHSNLANAAWR